MTATNNDLLFGGFGRYVCVCVCTCAISHLLILLFRFTLWGVVSVGVVNVCKQMLGWVVRL